MYTTSMIYVFSALFPPSDLGFCVPTYVQVAPINTMYVCMARPMVIVLVHVSTCARSAFPLYYIMYSVSTSKVGGGWPCISTPHIPHPACRLMRMCFTFQQRHLDTRSTSQ